MTAQGPGGIPQVRAFDGVSLGVLGDFLADDPAFAGGIFEMNTDNLRRWLYNPPGEKPGSRMPNLGLAPQEITQLIAYLQTLK